MNEQIVTEEKVSVLRITDNIAIRYKGGHTKAPGSWFFAVKDIKYIESAGGSVNIIFSKKTEEGDEIAKYFCGLKETGDKFLHLREFFKVNQSNIINVNHIKEISVEDEILLIKLNGDYRFEARGQRMIQFFNKYGP